MDGTPPGPGRVALTGALEHVALSTLLTVLEMERQTGTVELRSAGQRGTLQVCQGRIVRAAVEGSDTSGCEAVFLLLGWSSGRFRFRLREVEPADEINAPIAYLLLEAARRSDGAAA
jgi:hypothetical protein